MGKPGPGEAQMYEEMGTTIDVATCDFCKARGLTETVVLLVHNVDGDLEGYAMLTPATHAQPRPPSATPRSPTGTAAHSKTRASGSRSVGPCPGGATYSSVAWVRITGHVHDAYDLCR
jgi:hypothetical protein